MKQNTFMVNLLNKKEQLKNLYQKNQLFLFPILKGFLMFFILMMTRNLFPYHSIVNKIWVIAGISVLQAVLPIATLFYITSAFILCNLWNVGMDIFLAFLIFLIFYIFIYFRMDDHYLFLAAFVPALFGLKMGYLIPAAMASAVGLYAILPMVGGAVIYNFSLSLKEVLTLMSGDEKGQMGSTLIQVGRHMAVDYSAMLVIAGLVLAIVVTSLVHKIFHEKAWIFAIGLGNLVMPCVLLAGSLYIKTSYSIVTLLLVAILGFLLCLIIQFFKGIGDVSRIEKVTFEDDEYIYYVKAVPKYKVTQSDPNIKVMNETVQEEEISEPVEDENID